MTYEVIVGAGGKPHRLELERTDAGWTCRLDGRQLAVDEAGAGVVVVEAMKMQNEIKSPKKGRVKKISATLGAAVNPGDVLAIIE